MFQTPLILKADPRPDQWVLAAPLIWCDDRYGMHVAPAGFRTDLASTPFHADDTGPSRRPAVIHDAFYNIAQRVGRDYADAFLRDAILAEGGGLVRAQTYYYTVRMFGGFAWKAAAKEPDASHFETTAALNAWRLSDKTLRD
jgi:hypothetical protein